MRFIKNQEANGSFSNAGLKIPLIKIPLIGVILMWIYKMYKILEKILVARDRSMPEIYLRQPFFKSFTQNKEIIQNLKK